MKRKKLPNDRNAVTHKFSVGDQEGYIIVGLYEDGSPGELFVFCSKQGSTVSGLVDAVAIMMSLGLQWGVPLEDIVGKFKQTRYDPAGLTSNPKIPTATSILDYIARWLEDRFLGVIGSVAESGAQDAERLRKGDGDDGGFDSPPPPPIPIRLNSGVGCPDCGSLLAHEEGCLKCHCGYSRC